MPALRPGTDRHVAPHLRGRFRVRDAACAQRAIRRTCNSRIRRVCGSQQIDVHAAFERLFDFHASYPVLLTSCQKGPRAGVFSGALEGVATPFSLVLSRVRA